MPATVGAVRHSESPADAVALVEPRIESTSADLSPRRIVEQRRSAFVVEFSAGLLQEEARFCPGQVDSATFELMHNRVIVGSRIRSEQRQMKASPPAAAP